ncbi:surface glycoprotein, partial [Halobaculum sp. P14]|uniref:surface glycoprotein n=1 Tax=Halobaculum sp. P14 TaxID=3421638 RepID=UPI003EB9248D
MTDYNDKIRALFLTALMVFSVFAGTVAFSGAAAAGNSSTASSLSVTPSTVAPGETVSVSVTTSTSGKDVVFAIDADNDGSIQSDEILSAIQDNGAEDTDDSDNAVKGEITLPTGLSDGTTYTIVAIEEDSTYGSSSTEDGNADINTPFSVAGADTSDTVTAETSASPGAPTFRKATHYRNSTNSAIIELAFNEQISSYGGVNVGLEDGSVVSISSSNIYKDPNDPAQPPAASTGRLVVNTSGSVYTGIKNVSLTGTWQDASGIAPSSSTISATFAPTTVESDQLGTSTPYTTVEGYVGANVAIEAGSANTQISINGPGVDRNRGTGAGSHVYVLDTDDFQTGNYTIAVGNKKAYLALSDLGLTVESDESSFTTAQNVTGVVQA